METPEFKAFDKIARLNREVVVTEKLIYHAEAVRLEIESLRKVG